MVVTEMSSPRRGRQKQSRAGRPRAFEVGSVIEKAGDLFWERGYETTSIADLEKKTGLDRSSIYHTFGSKHSLFQTTLDCYVEANIEARLGAMRESRAGLAAVVSFFAGMAETLRSDRRSTRGCLMVNTIAALGSRDRQTVNAAKGYRDSFRTAFSAALSQAAANGETQTTDVRARSEMLTATTMGLFVTARIDVADAARVCDEVAAEVASWRLSSP